ncbi:MAG TPA: hypothetical protein VGR19_06450 [Allosphingosinicella sp.]|nr:hypothetical protein [Allosphingosinicella sp.]
MPTRLIVAYALIALMIVGFGALWAYLRKRAQAERRFRGEVRRRKR